MANTTNNPIDETMGNQQPTSTCYLSFENCFCSRLYVGFEKNATEKYLGSYTDTTFNPTGKVVLYETKEPIMALFVEDMYHRCWQVRDNSRFANRQKGGFSHQVRLILETPHGGNKHPQEVRDRISNTMRDRKLGTNNPAVRLAGNKANKGKKRNPEQALRIKAGTAMSHLKRGRYSRSTESLTKDQINLLCEVIEEAQRLGVYSIPASARETWESYQKVR